MPFSVSTFKTNVLKTDLQRPSLFKIQINGTETGQTFTDNEDILVKAAAVPAANIAALPINYAGRAYKLTGFRTYDTWTTTIINDEGFSAREKIMNWMYRISGGADGDRTAATGGPGGLGDGKVTLIGTDGLDKQTWKMHFMWPTELGEIALDWSSDAIEEYTCTWAYDYWTHGTVVEETSSVVDEDPEMGDEP